MEQISPRSVTQKSLLGQSRDYALLAFNFVGAIVYVRFSSLSWAIPEEKGLHSQTGEPFIWALSVIPIFSLFFAVNAVWGVIILARPTVAKRIFVAADSADLDCRCDE
jgi:hypothetical protein